MRMIAPLLFILLVLPSQAAEVFRCETENGVVRYSDTPCADGRTEKLDIETRPTDETAVEDRIEQRKKAITELDKAEADARETRMQAQAESTRRERQCAAARERLQKLQVARRVTTGEGDEQRYLEADEIEARRNEAAQQVAEFCGGE